MCGIAIVVFEYYYTCKQNNSQTKQHADETTPIGNRRIISHGNKMLKKKIKK